MRICFDELGEKRRAEAALALTRFDGKG